MDIKGFLADNLGHFSPYDIPNLIFITLLAAFLGWAVGYVGGQKSVSSRYAAWAALAALAVAFVRMQLPMALALLAVLLLVRPQFNGHGDRLHLVSVLVIGFGCGSGAALVMSIAAIPYLFILRWASKSDRPASDER
jgi:hypothetical protein